VSSRDVQIALHEETKLLPLIAASWAVRRRFVLSWIVTVCLILALAEALLAASDSSNASGNTTYSATDATDAQLLGVRFSSQAHYSRVVIDLSVDVRYKVGHLSNPERVYLDLSQTEISPQLSNRPICPKDGLVDQIRLGTDRGSVTRLVFDLQMPVRYRVSKLGSPAQLVVELSEPVDGAGLSGGIPKWSDVGEVSGQLLGRASPSSQGESKVKTGEPEGASSIPSNAKNLRAGNASAPHVYGDGEKAGLTYAGTSPPRNIFALGFNVGSTYDDNVFGNNRQRVGDVAFQFGPSLNVRREGQRLHLALSYQPHVRIYRRASELNIVDQTLGFDAAYRLSSRFSFRARTSAFFATGIFQLNQGEEFFPGLGTPSGLNQTVFTPTARQLMLSSRIDASYQARAHDSVDLFLSQSTLDFKQQISTVGNPQNTIDRDAGLLYQHRLNPQTTLGIDYLLQDIRFGSDSRTRVQSSFFSYAQQVSPNLTVSIFGGPQYSRLNELVPLDLGLFTVQIPVSNAGWNWAIGGILTKRLDKMAFQLTAQHQVSNGGGLLGAVISTSAGASVRRRLPLRWDASWSASYANNSSLDSTSISGAYQSLTAGAGLERSLTERLTLRIAYDFLHQRGTGLAPLPGNIDRNLWSLQFSYRFHEIALGK